MPTKITGGVWGQKAVSLGDLDNFLDWLVSGGDGSEPQDLYASVAWAFWCANLRADSVAQVPYKIYTLDSDEDTEENEAEFDIDLTAALWAAEMWLCLKGAAYWLKRSNRVVLLDLQVLNANTMRVHEYDADGPTIFRQEVGSKHKDFEADEIVYFRTFNPRDDINPGVASGAVSQVAGELVKHSNDWAARFFENGAVPAVLLTTDEIVPKEYRSELESRWNKMLQGVKRAFKTIVVGKGLKAQVIGQPVTDLALPELERTKREQILAAHKIPPGLAEAKTNRAERDALQFEFWTQTIKPELSVQIGPVVDKQLLAPLELRIGFQINKIEAVQKSEIEKAESASFLVGGVMLPAYEANVVSIDETRRVVSEILEWVDMPALDESFTPEDRAPPPLLSPGEDAGPEPPGDNPPKALAPGWGRHRVSLQN